MKNILKQKVIHPAFGEGTITNYSGSYITVEFNHSEKNFIFPDAFKSFLKALDDVTEKMITDLITQNDEQVRLNKEDKQREQEQTETTRRNQLSSDKRISMRHKKEKTYGRLNVAFKCNYCNGGASPISIGFNGVCSDNIITYNIKDANRTWCNSDDCPCKHYYNGEINRKELDSKCMDANGSFVCYESQMLRTWTAFAGIVQTGENKGRPMKFNNVQKNSLAILTTREPQMNETERFVFAVFLVDESYEGDNRDEGYVTTKSEYKIKLMPKEAHKIKFWNYHANGNSPEEARWSSGLHRYLKSESAAQVLRDIVKVKDGSPDKDLCLQFYEHFCKINSIDPQSLCNPSGALQRK